jgi:hypothetical protein
VALWGKFDVWNVWTKREMLRGFWWGNVKGRDRLEDLGADGLVKLKSVQRNRMGRRGMDSSDPGYTQKAQFIVALVPSGPG